MSKDSQNDLATEEQKTKLRCFGCSWDEGITKDQAVAAIDECVKRFSLSQRNEILTRKLSELNANGELNENDEKELAVLAVQLGFKGAFADDFLRKKFLEEFNPIKQRIEKAHLLTDEDLALIERLKKKYNIQLTMEGNIGIFRSAISSAMSR